MKTPAAILVEPGKPQVIDDIDTPDPGPTHVEVRQFASGICHSQLHELRRATTNVPLVLGHESTGVVTKTGKDVTHVKEGDHVMVTWVQRSSGSGPLPLPAVAPVTYQGKQINFGGPAFVGVYTWARDVLVDQQMVVPLDKDVPTDVSSIIGCAIMTGSGAALNSAQVRPGNSVAIIGVGGVGLSVVQGCANLDAYPIIAIDLTDEKLEFAKEFGATIGINSSKEDPVDKVRQLFGGTPNSGVDFAFDAIGLGVTQSQALQIARGRAPGSRDGGTAVFVGAPHGDPPKFNLSLIVGGGRVVRGAPGGCCVPDRDFPLFVRWYKEGKLPLEQMVTRRYRLDEINDACGALSRGEIAGRAIIEF